MQACQLPHISNIAYIFVSFVKCLQSSQTLQVNGVFWLRSARCRALQAVPGSYFSSCNVWHTMYLQRATYNNLFAMVYLQC